MNSQALLHPSKSSILITRYDSKRSLAIGNFTIKFTKIQYSISVLLLNGNPISDIDLVYHIFPGALPTEETRKCLDKHIDKIRSKLSPTAVTLYRINKYGYILLAN
jgi:hypothetical protein